MYNYREAMIEDIKEEVKNYDLSDFSSLDEFEEKLNDDLWISDSVTGNASGSYTCNSNTSREYVTENEKLLKETIEMFCIDSETVAERFINGDWEYFDVSIRCYLLGECIGEALEEMEITEDSFSRWYSIEIDDEETEEKAI